MCSPVVLKVTPAISFPLRLFLNMKVNADEMKDISCVSYCRYLHKLLHNITYKKGPISALFQLFVLENNLIILFIQCPQGFAYRFARLAILPGPETGKVDLWQI